LFDFIFPLILLRALESLLKTDGLLSGVPSGLLLAAGFLDGYCETPVYEIMTDNAIIVNMTRELTLVTYIKSLF